MKSLTGKVVRILLVVTALTVTSMKLFHAAYVERDIVTIWDRMGSLVAIISSLLIAAVVVLIITLRPVEKTLKKVEQNTTVSGEERADARKRISMLTLILIIINVVGYFIGPSVRILSGMRENIYTPIKAVFTILYDISLGFIASTIQISWLNITTMKAKKSLRFYYFTDKQKSMNIGTRKILFGMSAVLFAATFVAAAGYGFINETGTAMLNGKPIPGELRYLTDLSLLLLLIGGITFMAQKVNALELRNELKYLGLSLSDTISGKTDLSKRLSILHFDELGMLVHYINKYMDYLQTLIMEIKTKAGKVIQSSEDLSEQTSNVKKNAELLIQTNNGVKSNTELQTREIKQADSIINELTDSIEEVFRDIESQSAIVEESSASITEMSSNIESVNKIAEQADALASSLKTVSQEDLQSVNESMNVIKQIEETSESVSSFIGIISKIASQTNLLAMNAAIEAAHAGESGKGFAVVADEVRNLAEESSKGAKNITGQIKAMMNSIKSGVQKSEQTQSAFGRILDDVEKTSTIIHSASAAMEEQQIAATEILRSISDLIDATNHIRKMSADQNEKNEKMHHAMQRVISTSSIIEESVNKQETANHTISEIINHLYTIASKNKAIATSLEQAFQRLTKSDGNSLLQ